ncbi:MAG: hypothetical protein HY594_05525 [Candidatus Omnitrophica bacterium]|nr:hypothetical protein [Candidatus Omnitrophota bacterium]
MRTGLDKKRIEWLIWDSQFFGVQAGKILPPDSLGNSPERYVQEALQEAQAQGIRWLTARAHPWQTPWIHALEAAGFQLVDTLVTLGLDLKNSNFFWQGSPTPRIAPADRASDAELKTLMQLAKDAFADRSIWLDRFHADPRVPAGKADDLYAQWVKNSIRPDSPEQSMADQTFVCRVDGLPVGFITCQIKESGRRGIVSLNAVDAAYRKRGIYQELILCALNWFSLEKKCEEVRVRTNISSHGVRKAWARFQAVPIAEEHTFHGWV